MRLPFRICSVRQFRVLIASLPKHVLDLSGMGDDKSSTRNKIEQIIKTGTCDKFEARKKDSAFAARLELCKIWGIGPKRGKWRIQLQFDVVRHAGIPCIWIDHISLVLHQFSAGELVTEHRITSVAALQAAVLGPGARPGTAGTL